MGWLHFSWVDCEVCIHHMLFFVGHKFVTWLKFVQKVFAIVEAVEDEIS